MFRYLMKVDRRPPHYQEFGEETLGGLFGKRRNVSLTNKYIDAWFSVQRGLKSVDEKASSDSELMEELEKHEESIIAYRKIIWMIIWPPKLLEVGLAYLHWGLDQLCLWGEEDTTERGEEDTTESLSFSEPIDWLRMLGRILISPIAMAYGIIKYFGSPINQTFKPTLRKWKGDSWDRAQTIILVLVGGIVTGLMIAAIFFSGGGALPVFLAFLKSIALFFAPVITMAGSSLAATAILQTLTVFFALISSQFILQKLFAIPALLKDIGNFWHGGYDSKEEFVKTEQSGVERGLDDETEILADSTSENFKAHNYPLEFPNIVPPAASPIWDNKNLKAGKGSKKIKHGEDSDFDPQNYSPNGQRVVHWTRKASTTQPPSSSTAGLHGSASSSTFRKSILITNPPPSTPGKDNEEQPGSVTTPKTGIGLGPDS